MTLTQLRYFAAIVDAGLSITIAARHMHGTQSGLSKQIKQLEDELGFVLFTRRARSLTALTPAGQQVLEHVRPLLAHAHSIRTLGANLRKETNGELRIATTHTQAQHFLPTTLARLKKRFPEVAVHLAPGGDADSLRQLARGEVDLAIVSTGGQAPGADIALPLYRWDRVIVVPARHRLTRLGRAITLQDLALEPLVSYESSRDRTSSLRTAFAQVGVEPTITMTARDADLIKTYVRAGHGVGIVAEMVVDGPDPDLAVIPADGLFPTCTTWLLLRREPVLREFTFAFIGDLLPQVHVADLRRLLGEQEGADQRIEAPHWRDRPIRRGFARRA